MLSVKEDEKEVTAKELRPQFDRSVGDLLGLVKKADERLTALDEKEAHWNTSMDLFFLRKK